MLLSIKNIMMFLIWFFLFSCGRNSAVKTNPVDEASSFSPEKTSSDSDEGEPDDEAVIQHESASLVALKDSGRGCNSVNGTRSRIKITPSEWRLPVGKSVSTQIFQIFNEKKEGVTLTVALPQVEQGLIVRFNGGTYPGWNGSCKEKLGSLESCLVAVEVVKSAGVAAVNRLRVSSADGCAREAQASALIISDF